MQDVVAAGRQGHTTCRILFQTCRSWNHNKYCTREANWIATRMLSVAVSLAPLLIALQSLSLFLGFEGRFMLLEYLIRGFGCGSLSIEVRVISRDPLPPLSFWHSLIVSSRYLLGLFSAMRLGHSWYILYRSSLFFLERNHSHLSQFLLRNKVPLFSLSHLTGYEEEWKRKEDLDKVSCHRKEHPFSSWIRTGMDSLGIGHGFHPLLLLLSCLYSSGQIRERHHHQIRGKRIRRKNKKEEEETEGRKSVRGDRKERKNTSMERWWWKEILFRLLSSVLSLSDDGQRKKYIKIMSSEGTANWTARSVSRVEMRRYKTSGH